MVRKNPLWKRIPREIWAEKYKYLALFSFLVLTIALTSGFLVSSYSLETKFYKNLILKNVEDGNFVTENKISTNLIKGLENDDVDIYEEFYQDVVMENKSKIRIYENREEINLPDIINGKLPSEQGEIGLDRLYCKENNLKIGDYVQIDGRELKIVCLVALPDYGALFESNSNMIMNAKMFGVGVVSKDDFKKLELDEMKFCYGWKYKRIDLSDEEKNDIVDDMRDTLVQSAKLESFLRVENNQAVNFPGFDLGKDRPTVIWIIYILMTSLAFIFGITVKSNLRQEAPVIGTLRASGYSISEIILHYMMPPILITFFAGVVGNILGYTKMEEVNANLYLGSYSLSKYESVFDSKAFMMTTVIPVMLIMLIVFLMIYSTLRYSPLKLLRKDFTKEGKRNVNIKLKKLGFISKFRIRVLIQNFSTYIALFFGIFFATVMLYFSMFLMPLVNNFSDNIYKTQIADYQYILTTPVETKNESAEKYGVYSLENKTEEDITIYGIVDESEYIDVDLPKKENEVIVSIGYLEKFGLKIGDHITLKEELEDTYYDFVIVDSIEYYSTLSVFMPLDNFNEVLDFDDGYYNGYFAMSKITDIDDKFIASVITLEDLVAASNHMANTMSGIFDFAKKFYIIMYILMLYLLSKMVIDKNRSAISMIKILGFKNSEISKLYNVTTAFVVFISLLICVPLGAGVIKMIYFSMFTEIKGWMTFYISDSLLFEIFTIGVLVYAFVHILQMNKVKKIDMVEAIKNME